MYEKREYILSSLIGNIPSVLIGLNRWLISNICHRWPSLEDFYSVDYAMIKINPRIRAKEINSSTFTQISYQRDWYNDDNQAKLN